MRLDKLLANMGLGSRKDVRMMIRKGSVTVNGSRIKNPGHHIDVKKDAVYVENEKVEYRKYIYLLMNKPKGYISATEDPVEKTVIDLLSQQYKIFQPFPAGRLDKDTEGLLVLTNDGKFAHQITSPNRAVEKTYYVRIDGKVTADDIEAFRKGVRLDDGYLTKPAKLTILKSDEQSEIHLTITEGKFHQVKRMFLARGKRVIALKRIQIGALTLDPSLALGEYRELTEKEKDALIAR